MLSPGNLGNSSKFSPKVSKKWEVYLNKSVLLDKLYHIIGKTCHNFVTILDELQPVRRDFKTFVPKVKGKWKEGCTYFLNSPKSSIMATNGCSIHLICKLIKSCKKNHKEYILRLVVSFLWRTVSSLSTETTSSILSPLQRAWPTWRGNKFRPNTAYFDGVFFFFFPQLCRNPNYVVLLQITPKCSIFEVLTCLS